jgi:DNA-binding response OmpR family regulator
MKTLSVMQDTVGNQEFTVLVVDDDESTRRLYTTILGRAGFKVIEAPDGANALTVLGEGPVSLVLLDSRMPGMSGIDVLSVIRAERRTRTLPVILVTGETEPADRVGGLDAGADDYLTKPVDVKELVARVRAQLRGQSAWTEVVDGLQRRASAVDALSHLELGGRIDEAAQRICRVITSLEGLSGAAIIALTSPQFAVPLAAEGPLDISLNRGSALDETVARALWRRATDGPWLETVDSANAATLDVAANATAYSPLRVGDRLRGLLVVTSSTAVLESDDRTLSAAIDFGIVSSALLGPLLESDADVERTRATIRGCITDRRYVPN